jgi:4,5-DOPA dioxygenase extradiol
MNNGRLPAVFIGHGSPMNIVSDNDFTRSLAKLGKDLPRPEVILVVSAHWLTEGTFVTCSDTPEQIYDFYGFPEELYRYKYNARGSRSRSDEAAGCLREFNAGCGDWGLDHASWAVLRHMYPSADIPVIELSLCVGADPRHHFEIGRALRPLREKGFLIIGSGNIVHNLRVMKYDTDAQPFGWAVDFDRIVKEHIISGDFEKLIDYNSLGENAKLSIPTNDHYLPMLYALALKEEGERAVFTYEGIQNGSVSMRSFIITA